MRVMLVLVTVVALLLGGAPMAKASGKRGGGARASRPKTQAVKKHTRKLPGGKRVPVKTYKRAEAQR